MKRLLNAEEVAAMLGVPKSWVWAASRRGELPTVVLGRYRRYRHEAVEEWIKQQEGSGANGKR
jgi:excisionase family DNA binding protein